MKNKPKLTEGLELKDKGRWHVNPTGICPQECPGCALSGLKREQEQKGNLMSKPTPEITPSDWEVELNELIYGDIKGIRCTTN